METFAKDRQYYKFCLYGFLKNLRFYDAFLLLFLLDNGMSYSLIGVLYASREIVATVFEVPSGLIADLYGRKNALIVAFLLYILSYIAFYLSSDFTLLFTAMILIGVGDAFRSGSHKGMIMDYLRMNNWGQHKVNYYGHTRSWSQLGSALSALFAGLLVFYAGNYRAIYLISIVPYLLNFVNIYTYPDEINHSNKTKETKDIRSIWRNIMQRIRNRRVLEIVNSSALHSAFLKSIKDYIQPLMINVAAFIPIMSTIHAKNKSGLAIGIIYFFIFLLSSFASKYAGRFSASRKDKVEVKTLFLGLFSGLFCGILFHYGFWIVSLILFVSIYIIENLRKPILTGVLADNVPNEILTSVISTQALYKTFVTVILSLVLGVIADMQGVGFAIMVVSAALLILTLMIERKTLTMKQNY